MDKSKVAVDTYNEIASIYSEEYFNDKSDLPYLDNFLSLLPSKARILDMGCGPGQFSKYLYDKGFEVEGIDLSENMLEIAKKEVPEVRFKLMDMRNLNYKSNSFDGLLVSYSLIHIASDDIPLTLKGFARILKPGGCAFFITQKGRPDHIVEEPLKKGQKMFINFFTPKRICSLLLKSGFTILSQKETKISDPNSLSRKVIYTIARKANN